MSVPNPNLIYPDIYKYPYTYHYNTTFCYLGVIRLCCCFVGILIRSSSWDFCCLFALFVLVLVLILVVLLLVVGFWWDPHRKEGDLRISQLVSALPGMRGRSHLPSRVKWDSVV